MKLRWSLFSLAVLGGILGSFHLGRVYGMKGVRASDPAPLGVDRRHGLTCYMNGLPTSEGGVVRRGDGAKVECLPVKADWVVLDTPITP
jgi:hypothetical protein